MNKKILRLAIPNIITNITVPLLGMVDTAIAGHLESDLYIGAIAVGSLIFNFIYWNFSFLRMGTSGFTAQAYGAGSGQESVNVLLRSLLVAFSAGVLIIALQYFLLKAAFFFISASAQTQLYAAGYFYVYVWAAPFVLGLLALTGWFIGMQDAKTPMYISILTNVVNIALSLIFVFGFNMQIKGLALGTALAQVTAFFTAVFIWSKKYGYLRKYLSLRFVKNIEEFKPFFKVNGDIFLRSAGLILVTVFFTSASAKMGDTILAVNALLMQLFILFSYMMDGFAYAAEALTGRYFGAKDYKKMQSMIKRLFIWGLAVSAVFTLLYLLFTNTILGILTDKANIIAASKEFQKWALLFPFAGFAAFLWDGIYIGVTASKQMRNSMFTAVILFFIIYYALSPVIGNNALWLAFISYLAMRGIMQKIMFKSIERAAGIIK